MKDDFTGGVADETVRFSLDGRSYEIDPSAENTTTLREAIEPFAQKARKVHAVLKAGDSKTASSSRRNKDTLKIRRWVQQNGYEVAERGQIHQRVRDAYCTAQNITMR